MSKYVTEIPHLSPQNEPSQQATLETLDMQMPNLLKVYLNTIPKSIPIFLKRGQ